MDHWDFMDDRTMRSIEQTARQAADQMSPLLNDPAIADLAKWTAPPGVLDGALAAINRDTASVMETALAGSKIQSQFINDQIAASARAGLKDLFPGPGEMSRLGANLDLVFKTPTVADYLAKTGASSIIRFQGPTIAEMMGSRIDTKALMGLSGLTETAGTMAEQWRLANTGALSSFGESFGSLREALGFEQSLKSSQLAQAVLREAWKLDEGEARRWAEADLTEPADTRVEERLTADPDLAEVIGVVQRYFVVYLGYAPNEAHRLVRRLVWIVLFGTFVSTMIWGPPAAAVVMGAVGTATSKYNADSLATKAANTLIPDGKPDTTS